MKPKIILVGGGGHCISCIDVIEQEGKFEIAGIVDGAKSGNHVLGYPVLGCDDDLRSLRKSYEYALVTIGHIKTSIPRMKLYNYLIGLKFNLPSIISPRSYVSSHAFIQGGTVVMHDSLINANVEIGHNCIINTKALVEHDSKIGNHCHISTGAIINGGVCVNQGTFVGSNSAIREGAKVPENYFVKSATLFTGITDE